MLTPGNSDSVITYCGAKRQNKINAKRKKRRRGKKE